MVDNPSFAPEWAVVAKNSVVAKTKYQHLVASLRGRLQSAIDRGDRQLVRELERELDTLEREL
jgi:hypothetical protein